MQELLKCNETASLWGGALWVLHTKYTHCILESVLLIHPRVTVFPIFFLFIRWNMFRQMVPSQHKYCNCKLLYCLFINQVLQVFKDIRHFCIVVYNYKVSKHWKGHEVGNLRFISTSGTFWALLAFRGRNSKGIGDILHTGWNRQVDDPWAPSWWGAASL